MAKMGRPKKEINKEEFEKLCGLQCTLIEVCEWFDISEKTLEAFCKKNYKDEDGKGMTFSKVFAVKRGKGLISLRRNQFRLAEKHPAMAIFLGKNYLGQSDKIEQVITDDIPHELTVNFVHSGGENG